MGPISSNTFEDFEGTEKKLELEVKDGDLRVLEPSFWEAVCAAARSKILSCMVTDSVQARLLSESSLLVTKNRLTMITCGRTTLAQAACRLIRELGSSRIRSLAYERRSEWYPGQQLSSFAGDAEELATWIPGESHHLAAASDRYVSAFYYDCDAYPSSSVRDWGVDLRMYGARGRYCPLFAGGVEDGRQMRRRRTVLEVLLPDWQLDEFGFRPCGYSCNAIRDSDWATLHVTPGSQGNYLGFHACTADPLALSPLLATMIEAFAPERVDLSGRWHDVVPLPPLPGFRWRLADARPLPGAVTWSLFSAERG